MRFVFIFLVGWLLKLVNVERKGGRRKKFYKFCFLYHFRLYMNTFLFFFVFVNTPFTRDRVLGSVL